MTDRLKIIELFAGSGTFSRVARGYGHTSVTVDINAEYDPDICMNILDVTSDILNEYDVVWASPDCTTYSLAACYVHRTPKRLPKTSKAKTADAVTSHLFNLLRNFGGIFFVENPRALLRKMPFTQDFARYRQTITYCKYGDLAMKPTDIWTNSGWIGRPVCRNGSPCHQSAPRGSKTGTQGKYATWWRKGDCTLKRSSAHERAKLPVELCEDIIQYLGSADLSRVRNFAAGRPFQYMLTGVWGGVA